MANYHHTLPTLETYGLHEIHISVDPHQVALLRWFCKDNKIKPIMAVSLYGEHPNQLMISKYKNGTSNDCLTKANELAEKMTEYGLIVLRVKIEAMMHCKGVPTDNEVAKVPNYWEFHLKMEVENSNELKRLSTILATHGAHVSFNAFKTELYILVTLRLCNCSHNRAMECKADLIEDIQKNGFVTNHEIHQEFCIYDSNIGLDAGWIEHTNTLTN